MAIASNLGFPRIGKNRELKKATESYWRQEISKQTLLQTARTIRLENWQLQHNAGITHIPCNDFSFYDQVLDMSCLLGNIPERFHTETPIDEVDLSFYMARGTLQHLQADNHPGNNHTTHACEMTKWFDTNYHFIVPEFSRDSQFQISSTKVFNEFKEALDIGILCKPILIGPLSYLTLGKVASGDKSYDRFHLLDRLLPVYADILQQLYQAGAQWVQIDEPAFALNLSDRCKADGIYAFRYLKEQTPQLQLQVSTYFGELRDNLSSFLNLQADALHIDAVTANKEISNIVEQFPEDKMLSVGIINGRNIWKSNLSEALKQLKLISKKINSERLIIAPSCSLLHIPVSLKQETLMNPKIKPWLAFAEEKLEEICLLTDTLNGHPNRQAFKHNSQILQQRFNNPLLYNKAVRLRCDTIVESYYHRQSDFSERYPIQQSELQLPIYPTTSVGSFPQTQELRKIRNAFRQGKLQQHEYRHLIRNEIRKCIDIQQQLDIDVLVHGEPERNDMVEYFAEYLDGYLLTTHGWVQSYGTRYVKPPILYGDISRPQAITVEWISYAQNLSEKPVKGMLTGPVTMSKWSFIRDDQAFENTIMQMALAIRDEVNDLEQAGIRIIQIDEPALREAMPLRTEDWQSYLNPAVRAFRLSANGAHDKTQIHTHMCYAEFNDIITAIAAMDADVITIETARSNMELLDVFVDFNYPNGIGPGVYDIHSPNIPDTKEIFNLLVKACQHLPDQYLWVNPDCGLKTRRWPEVKKALKHMVLAAKQLRNKNMKKNLTASEKQISIPN